MRESCMYGSERGARGNSRPYRTRREFMSLVRMSTSWGGRASADCQREVLRLDQMIANSGSEWAQKTAAAFAEVMAREFDSSAFEGVPASPDLEWLRACIDYLARGDA